jgi:hypothetical protein
MSETASEPQTHRAGWFGWPGLVVSLIALAVAASSPWLGELLDPPPPPVEEVVADIAVRIKDRMAAKLKGETPPLAPRPRAFRWSESLPGIAVGFGVLGLSLGIIGLVRREDLRLSLSAIVVGVAAVVFIWAMMIAGAILFLLLFGWVLSLVQATP